MLIDDFQTGKLYQRACLFLCATAAARKGNRMKQQTAEPLTAEELALVRAYNAAYMREYRKKHPEKTKEYQRRSALNRAKRAAAAGLFEVPQQTDEQTDGQPAE